MKLNKLLAGLGAAVLTAALAVTASAADPLVVWDFSQADNTAFYNADGTVAFSVNNGTATYDADNACLNLDVEGGDPFFVLPNQGTFPAENSFVRVKYNLTDISDWSTSIYFTTDTVQWSETGHWKGFYDGDDGEWCEQTFYMTECAAWAGTITDMRLDIFDSAWAGQNAKVAYVAVFGNEADANAFDFAAWQAAGRPVTLEAPAAEAPAAEATASAGLPAAYPSSGTEVPADSVLIAGELIGSELGWDGTAGSGRASAFDGDPATFFDPATASVDWCGIDAGEEMILTKIVIRPRDNWADRFDGATIEASNDPEFEDSVELFYNANGAAAEITYIDCTADMDADANTGYRYFRYINYMQHGDVSEVELYGKAKDGSNPVYGAAAATEAPAAEAAPATEVIAIDAYEVYQEYPAVDPIANNGASYATVEEAVASLGKTAITGYTFVDGTTGNGNEGPEMLWDGDTATKFCTSEFPTTSIAALDGEYAIDGIIMATANDNSSYNQRSPYEWAIYGSNDGAAWTALAYGDDYFFEEVDFTYFAAPVTTEGSYKYIMFQSEGGLAGCFQVSELVLTGTKVAGAAAEAPAAEEAPAAAEEVNIFANATVVEISGLETEGANTGDMAIDGDMATRWSSNTDDAAHIIVDLGAVTPVDSLDIYWETACAADYTVEVSEDNANWTVVATVTDNTVGASPVGAAVSHEWDTVNARYIKINCTRRNTEWGNSIWEMVAYAAEAPVAEEAPVVEEVPAEEPAAEEVEEPVVVEEEVVEEAPVEEAAETFDFGVIAVVAALVSAAGYAISKKR